MKILVTGAGGMLGNDLMTVLKDTGWVEGVDINDFDITVQQDCMKMVMTIKPDWIVNSAAFTAVDDCENLYEKAYAVNAVGAANIAEAAKVSGARMVHISTDYVFDGNSSEPYSEEAITNPQTKYGISKLEGENRVIHILKDRALVVRTAWLFGAHGKNFVETILKIADRGNPLKVVADQVGSPTYTLDLASGIKSLIQCEASGIVHVTNSGYTSWHGFASFFLKKTHPHIHVVPIPASEYPLPTPRPGYSVLALNRFTKITDSYMPDWHDAVDRYLKTHHFNRLEENI